jgi:hypothetical protein
VTPGSRPALASDQEGVRKTFESFEAHLAENDVDYAQTKLFLGRQLVIDPKTESATDPAANALFGKQYRKGYELPRV